MSVFKRLRTTLATYVPGLGAAESDDGLDPQCDPGRAPEPGRELERATDGTATHSSRAAQPLKPPPRPASSSPGGSTDSSAGRPRRPQPAAAGEAQRGSGRAGEPPSERSLEMPRRMDGEPSTSGTSKPASEPKLLRPSKLLLRSF